MSQDHSRDSSATNTSDSHHAPSHNGEGHGGSYLRFVLMILTAAVVMYAVMYLNTYSLDHVRWSWTRFFMTMMSTATMAVIMLAFMLRMYGNRMVNVAIVGASVLLFGTGLFLVRSQATVGDEAWMRAMIPHHSIAILTSERADIDDPRVRQLADEIIEAQRAEIAEMEGLLKELEARR